MLHLAGILYFSVLGFLQACMDTSKKGRSGCALYKDIYSIFNTLCSGNGVHISLTTWKFIFLGLRTMYLEPQGWLLLVYVFVTINTEISCSEGSKKPYIVFITRNIGLDPASGLDLLICLVLC